MKTAIQEIVDIIEMDYNKGYRDGENTGASNVRSVCPKCEGKGWYHVDEWVGSLQGRKDCDCKPAASLANQLMEDKCWCPACNKWVSPKDVTYKETHDVRSGGCGNEVE